VHEENMRGKGEANWTKCGMVRDQTAHSREKKKRWDPKKVTTIRAGKKPNTAAARRKSSKKRGKEREIKAWRVV